MSHGYPPPANPQPQQPQQHGSAVTALVLGILGLVLCGLLGIPAYVVGRRAEAEILASGGVLTGEGMARAGWICGLVAMGMLALGLLLVIGMFAFGGLMMFSTS